MGGAIPDGAHLALAGRSNPNRASPRVDSSPGCGWRHHARTSSDDTTSSTPTIGRTICPRGRIEAIPDSLAEVANRALEAADLEGLIEPLEPIWSRLQASVSQ